MQLQKYMTSYLRVLQPTCSGVTRLEMPSDFIKELNKAQSMVRSTRLALIEVTQEQEINLTKKEPSEIRNRESVDSTLMVEKKQIHDALIKISLALADGYAQVNSDLQDKKRSSWAGTAHELREVLATLLRTLAPDNDVIEQSWYKKEPDTSGPTQKQRVRYILQQHGAGSKELEVAGQVNHFEEMVGDIVRATYSRASDAAHRSKKKREVVRLVKYFDAFAYDLLDLE